MFVDANRGNDTDEKVEDTMDTDLMIVVTVMGEGETCADQDKTV